MEERHKGRRRYTFRNDKGEAAKRESQKISQITWGHTVCKLQLSEQNPRAQLTQTVSVRYPGNARRARRPRRELKRQSHFPTKTHPTPRRLSRQLTFKGERLPTYTTLPRNGKRASRPSNQAGAASLTGTDTQVEHAHYEKGREQKVKTQNPCFRRNLVPERKLHSHPHRKLLYPPRVELCKWPHQPTKDKTIRSSRRLQKT